jgi:hypothetical protein
MTINWRRPETYLALLAVMLPVAIAVGLVPTGTTWAKLAHVLEAGLAYLGYSRARGLSAVDAAPLVVAESAAPPPLPASDR